MTFEVTAISVTKWIGPDGGLSLAGSLGGLSLAATVCGGLFSLFPLEIFSRLLVFEVETFSVGF